MQQMQTREISANDYDTLLKLDEHRNKWSNKATTKCKFCDECDSNEEMKRPNEELVELNCKLILIDIGLKLINYSAM